MPRGGGSRGGGGGGGGLGRMGSGSPRRRPYSTGRPSSSPPSKPTTTPGQPSMLKHMAATAGGVVAGSLLANAILGSARESIPPEVSCSEGGQCNIPEDDPCAMELRNFIDCAYKAQEMTACDGYNTLLKECRRYTERQGRK